MDLRCLEGVPRASVHVKQMAIPARRISPSEEGEWLRLRQALWPNASRARLGAEAGEYREAPHTHVVFVVARPDGRLSGFAELRLRSQADGCSSSPVAYLEGWYVEPDMRKLGAGRALVTAAENWARERGCQEFASDSYLDNEDARAAHRALGFEERRPIVQFRKRL